MEFLLMLLLIIASLIVIVTILFYKFPFTSFIYKFHQDCKSKVCLVGKTALVTGGNSGIGYQIVLALAQRGCRVIIADKNEDENLLESIYEETHNRNVVFKHVDLASFTSVRALAKNIKQEEEKLDILINNAGTGRHTPVITEDGLDITMQVNFFSGFLLTRLLEDLLKAAKGRIIFTSSGTAYFHQFSIDDLKILKEPVKGVGPYPNSKLCLIMIAEVFAEKLKPYGVTSNSYHPGIVRTPIFQSALNSKGSITLSAWFAINGLALLAFLMGKTPEQGAQTAIHLACANEVKNTTGEFFFETKPTGKPKLAQDKRFCEAVWRKTEELVKFTEDH